MGMLLGASIKMVVRDRQSLFWALIFPLIFLGIFRMFSFDDLGETDLLVAADQSSPVQAALVSALQDVDFLDVEVRADLDEAAALLAFEDEGFDAALFVMPGVADGSVDALLLNAVNDPIGHAVTKGAIASVVDDVNAALVDAPRVIAFETRAADVEVESFFEFLAPGIIGMGLMTFGVIGLAASLSRYREEGVLRRVRATPLAPWKFSASVVMAHLLVGVVQVVILIAIAAGHIRLLEPRRDRGRASARPRRGRERGERDHDADDVPQRQLLPDERSATAGAVVRGVTATDAHAAGAALDWSRSPADMAAGAGAGGARGVGGRQLLAGAGDVPVAGRVSAQRRRGSDADA
jgi:hypothetical protein